MSFLNWNEACCSLKDRKTLKRVDAVYHCTLHFITGYKYHMYYCVLYENIGWSSVATRIKLHYHFYLDMSLTKTASIHLSII